MDIFERLNRDTEKGEGGDYPWRSHWSSSEQGPCPQSKRDDDEAHAIIELALIKWLLDCEWSLYRIEDHRYQMFRPTLGEVIGDTLIEVLLAAAEREVGR